MAPWLVTLVLAATPQDLPAWLAGDWCRIDGDRRLEERWLAPTANLMLATNRVIVGDQTRSFEFLRIERDEAGTVTYVAQPGGRPPTRFALTRQEPRRVRFENPEHDFPQVIEYVRNGEQLTATASGGDTVLDFRMIACPD